MKILIIGSSGFIGSHLVPALISSGHDVVGLDLNRPTADYGLSEFYEGDVRKLETLNAAFEDVDCVINLAAVHFDVGHEDDEYFETNERGTGALLDAMNNAGITKHIFTSSVAVYGDRDDEADEDTVPNPAKAYGQSKLAGEKLIHQWSEQGSARSAVIVRPCLVFGERNIANMRNLIRQIDKPFFVMFGNGRNIKAVAYVENLVETIRHCVEHLEPGVRTFNYADKPDLSVNEMVDIIHDELGKKRFPINMPLWLGVLAAVPFEIASRVLHRTLPISIARVRKLSTPTRFAAQRIRDDGVVQRVETEEGLRRMVRSYLAEKAQDG